MKNAPLKILACGTLIFLGLFLIFVKSAATDREKAIYSQKIAPWDGYVDYFEVSKDGMSFSFLLPQSAIKELADGKSFNLDGGTVHSMLPSICYTSGHEPPCGLNAEGTLKITNFSDQNMISGELAITRVRPAFTGFGQPTEPDVITNPITIPFSAKYQK